MIPDYLLPHEVVVVTPATSTNTYGDVVYDYDYGAGATRTPVRAWLQQDRRSEPHPDGRDPLDQRWLLVTNHAPISGLDRVEWADHPAGPVVYEVDGPPEPVYAPRGLHHTEATLRIVDG